MVLLSCNNNLYAQIENGDFENGDGGKPFYWSTSAYQNEGVNFTWEAGCGIAGSRCISITNSGPNDSRWVQYLVLKPLTNYILTGYIKGENIVHHQGGSIFANFSIMNTWDFAQVSAATFAWRQLTFCFTTDKTGNTAIALRLGHYGNVVTGKVWFDNISIEETEDFCGQIKNEGSYITTLLEEDDLTVISEANMDRWLQHLDSAYLKYEELVGFRPYDGNKIEVRSVPSYPGGWAVAGNPIKWYQIYIKEELTRINNDDDWSFGILHEISHDFDHHSWNFYGEHFANFNMVYVLEELNGKVRQWNRYFIGAEAKDIQKIIYDSRVEEYNSAGNDENYRDGITYRLIDIKDSIGWLPFKKTFRNFVETGFEGTIPEKYEAFLDFLSRFSGKDVRKYLPKKDRDLFLQSLSRTNVPNSPDNYHIAERNCNTVKLKWDYTSSDIISLVVERRTANTWFTPVDTIYYLPYTCPGSCIWQDTTICLDSTYFYRLRARNSYGVSAYTIEKMIVPLVKSETPIISPQKYSLCQGESLNMIWKGDTTHDGKMNLYFLSNNSLDDVGADTLFIIKNLEKFNRKLLIETNIKNEADSSNIYLRLNVDLKPGQWTISLDSLYSSRYPNDSIFQFSFIDSTFPIQSWICSVKGIGTLERVDKQINLSLDDDFYGEILTIYRSTKTCSYIPVSDTFTLNVKRKLTWGGPIMGSPIACQGETNYYSLPNVTNDQHVNWSFFPNEAGFGSTRNDTLFLELDTKFHGSLRIHSYADANCGNELFHDSLMVNVTEKPLLDLNLTHDRTQCYEDSLILYSMYPDSLCTWWISPENEVFGSNDTVLAPITDNTQFRYFLKNKLNCQSDTGHINFEVIKVTADFTAVHTEAFVDEMISFLNLSENADTFTWYLGDGSISSEKNPEHFYTLAKNYSISLVGINTSGNCVDSINKVDYINILDIPDEVEKPHSDNVRVHLYPIPAENFITLVFDDRYNDIISVDLYTISGKKLYSVNGGKRVLTLNLGGYPSGQYLIKVEFENKTFTKKFVIR